MKQVKMVTIPDNLFNKTDYPGMVHWFSPKVLFNVVQKVLTSTIFAQYADRRLVHASLDPFTAESLIERCGGELGICGSKKSAVWVDYVADLGDGFDSTYAIAYLIGQKSIVVDGLEMPRADCLIMGGDEARHLLKHKSSVYGLKMNHAQLRHSGARREPHRRWKDSGFRRNDKLVGLIDT